MKNQTVLAKTKERKAVGVERLSGAELAGEASKVTIGTVGVAGMVIGLWAFACLAGGLFAAGGPLELARSWWGAVTGM